MQSLLIFILVAVILYILFVSKESYDDASPRTQKVPATIIQNIIQQIVDKKPELHPIDTVFVDSTGPSTVSGRFLFLDKNSYSGVQYDVTANTNGAVRITDMSSSVNPEMSGPFMPYGRATYSDVGAATMSTMDDEVLDAGISGVKDMLKKI
jgi:hypothetical protein